MWLSDTLKIKNNTAEGKIYEFMDFKKVLDDAVKEFNRLMEEHKTQQNN